MAKMAGAKMAGEEAGPGAKLAVAKKIAGEETGNIGENLGCVAKTAVGENLGNMPEAREERAGNMGENLGCVAKMTAGENLGIGENLGENLTGENLGSMT
jgi:hypothetical protein